MIKYFTNYVPKSKLIIELSRNTRFFTVYTDADQSTYQLASEYCASFKTK